MLRWSDSRYHRLMLVFLGMVACVALLTFRDYGITWDEELQSRYGLAVVDYYASLFHDDGYREIFNLYLYGGMFDGIASLVDRTTPFFVYDTRHLINAMFGILGLWGTWRLGRFIGGGAVGFLALILLTFTPMYYGHMFNNPKDIPFACGVVWSLYFMMRCYARMSRPDWGLLIKLSVILGLTLGVRVGGVMFFALWLVPMGFGLLRDAWPWEQRWKNLFMSAGHVGIRIVLPVAIISYIVMLLCWPWAQENPILNPLRALSEFSNFPQDVEVLLDGTIYRSTQLPWYYVPLYFAVQLPELLLVLAAVSIVVVPVFARQLLRPQRQGIALILLAMFVPPLYAVVRQPALYDTVRHFLFVVPLLCVIAAFSAVHLSRWAVAEFELVWSKRALSAGMFGILILHVLVMATEMVRLHPYEYIYANSLWGGVPGIYGKYELDYWGASFKEAAQQLQQFVAREGGIPPGKIYRIAICGPWDAAMIYLPPDYDSVVANKPAEFFLSTTRWMCQNMRPGKEIIRIEREGVPLSIIKDLRGLPAEMP